MLNEQHSPRTFRFGAFELDEARRELRHRGQRAPIEPIPWRLLRYLLVHRERVVPRRELLSHLWPDLNEAQRARLLNGAVSDARKALRDSEPGRSWIQTHRKHGYGFRVGVEVAPAGARSASQAQGARGASRGGPPGAEPGRRPLAVCQLRDPPERFVGREGEVLELVAQIEAGARVISLVGMGGVGKTTLACAVAARVTERYPEAQLHVDLAGTRSAMRPERAMLHVLRALGEISSWPRNAAEIRSDYCALLRGRRILILLDDARDAAQVEPLVPPGRDALVLVTSRRRLLAGGARPHTVRSLQPADAVRVLTPRPDLPAETAHAIVEHCGFLPLALVLAAGALDSPDVDPAEYLAELARERHRLEVLDELDPARGIEVSLEQGLSLLEPALREQLAALSILPPGFDRAAARAVWGARTDEAARALRRLRELHWLDHEGSGVHARYRMHDLVRLFALKRLDRAVRREAELRHAAHFLSVLEAIEASSERGVAARARAQSRLGQELHQLEAAFGFACAHAARDARAARVLERLPLLPSIEIELPAQLRSAWCQRALRRLGGSTSERDRARLHECLGTAQRDMGRLREARASYHEALLLLAPEARTSDRIGALLGAGITTYYMGAPLEGASLLQESLDAALALGDVPAQGRALRHLAVALYLSGELRRAELLLESSLTLARDLDDPVARARALVALANVDRALAAPARAAERVEVALSLARAIGSRKDTLHATIVLVFVRIDEGRLDQAEIHSREALELAHQLQDRRGEAQALGAAAVLSYAQRKLREAHTQARRSLRGARRVQDLYLEGWALGTEGVILERRGRRREALDRYTRWLAHAQKIPDRRGEAAARWCLAMCHARAGELVAARESLEACVAYEEEMHHPRAAAHRALADSMSGG